MLKSGHSPRQRRGGRQDRPIKIRREGEPWRYFRSHSVAVAGTDALRKLKHPLQRIHGVLDPNKRDRTVAGFEAVSISREEYEAQCGKPEPPALSSSSSSSSSSSPPPPPLLEEEAEVLSEGSVEPKEETLSPIPHNSSIDDIFMLQTSHDNFQVPVRAHSFLKFACSPFIFTPSFSHPPLHTYKNSCSPWPKSWRHTSRARRRSFRIARARWLRTTTMPPHNRRPPILR